MRKCPINNLVEERPSTIIIGMERTEIKYAKLEMLLA